MKGNLYFTKYNKETLIKLCLYNLINKSLFFKKFLIDISVLNKNIRDIN